MLLLITYLQTIKHHSMKNYLGIKTYEDACASLGISPITDFGDDTPDEVAYKKLKTISRALWGKDFEPRPDAKGGKWYYYPWFALYTQAEIDRMSEADRGALLAALRALGRLRGSVLCLRLTVRRTRMRTVGSVCAKRQGQRRSILDNNSSNCGLTIC
jgi:hypothetical protein